MASTAVAQVPQVQEYINPALTCPFLNKKDEWKVQIVSLLFGALLSGERCAYPYT
jgi:hypothetical protein